MTCAFDSSACDCGAMKRWAGACQAPRRAGRGLCAERSRACEESRTRRRKRCDEVNSTMRAQRRLAQLFHSALTMPLASLGLPWERFPAGTAAVATGGLSASHRRHAAIAVGAVGPCVFVRSQQASVSCGHFAYCVA